MAGTFFFYDLETTGLGAQAARIMQFAGQRTDADLKPIGEPVNVLIKLAGDVLPDPSAILITGITPQQTLQDGMTEAEFLKYFYEEIVQPDTTFLGYNTVRFDDEFMRYLHYRNFYDPYEWQWADGCSRWDLLDVVRMTRALRPDGIKWPTDKTGKPTNRLELLTKENGLDHAQAHDALSDVYATIAVARLIKEKQPQLFEYLFSVRGKRAVAEVIEQARPFVYTSGRYSSANLHTTAAVLLAKSGNDAALVYDLRQDPAPFLSMTPEQLADAWRYKKDPTPEGVKLPVKTVKYNRCPAIAPLGVIKDAPASLDLSLEVITKHLEILKKEQQAFAAKVLQAIDILDVERDRERPKAAKLSPETVDTMLYDGFFEATDKQAMRALRVARPEEIGDMVRNFKDARLATLVPLYKARNFPGALSSDERAAWDKHVAAQLFDGGPMSRLAQYFAKLQELTSNEKLTKQQQYLLEELRLYGESIVPSGA